MTLDTLLKDVQVLAVICNQWGDTGKGKFVDFFGETWADIVARGTGGNNAGHTVVIRGKTYIFHLLPSGILHDHRGVTTILGNGMVIDLAALTQELAFLDAEGLSYNHLMISKDAHVVLPSHVSFDKARNQDQTKGGIGTTGRGIGPAYTDKVARKGITIGDLFHRDTLAKKLIALGVHALSVEEVVTTLQTYVPRIQPFVRNTVNELHAALRAGKKVLIEGAQGLLLSIEHGTYPYVTSSDCSLNGTASGVGIPASAVDLTLGLVKFPFMTRVGAGPFPTELSGKRSEEYCGVKEHTLASELAQHRIPHTIREDGSIHYDSNHPEIRVMMNDDDPLIQSIGIRLAAREYGATTGRPRRIGWTDAVAGRYAQGINRAVLVLTKVDSIAGKDSFQICYGYRDGATNNEDFSKEEAFLRRVTPRLRTYEGYETIRGETDYRKLPGSLRVAINDFERFTHSTVGIVSTGPEREETIIKV